MVKKKARLWLHYMFVKFWTVYPIPVYVREKSCDETHFELFKIVWQVCHKF